MNESDFRESYEKRLAPYFNIYKEEKSKDFGSLKRIDAIIENKCDNRLVFGIEFKRPGKKPGSNISQWLNQAKQYSYSAFDFRTNGKTWGLIPVLICPQLSGKYLEYVDGSGHSHNAYTDPLGHHNVNSLIFGTHNLGEIRTINTKGLESLRIIINNVTIWQEISIGGGVEEFFVYERYRQVRATLRKRRIEYREEVKRFLQNSTSIKQGEHV